MSILTLRTMDGYASLVDHESGEILFTEDPDFGIPVSEIEVKPTYQVNPYAEGFDTTDDLFEDIAWELNMSDLNLFRQTHPPEEHVTALRYAGLI